MAKRKSEKKSCNRCKKMKIEGSFYTSNSPIFDGRVPICKPCLSKMIDLDDIQTVKKVLQQIDKPFIWSLWKTSEESEHNTWGAYMKNINSLPQYRTLTHENSMDIDYLEYEEEKDSSVENIKEMETDRGSITLTKEIKAKFGSGFSNREYLDMEKFYQDMMRENDISTTQHKKLLVRLCKLNVMCDRTMLNDPNSFDKYNKQYEAIMKSSGFRPADKVAGNEKEGIRSFSQIYEEVERDGYIEPYDIEANQDIVDKVIMYMLNYQLKLFNMGKMSEPPEDTPKVGEDE